MNGPPLLLFDLARQHQRDLTAEVEQYRRVRQAKRHRRTRVCATVGGLPDSVRPMRRALSMWRRAVHRSGEDCIVSDGPTDVDAVAAGS